MIYKMLCMTAVLFLLVSCTDQNVADKAEKAYVMPQPTDMVSYEIEQRDGYPMDVYVIEPESLEADPFSEWQAWNEKREAADKYRMYRALRQSEDKGSFAETEEDRIESYCDEYGFVACKGISVTCEELGCHSVAIACGDDDFDAGVDDDDECRRFDVTVGEEIDDARTEESDDEVLSGGSTD